MPDKDLLNNERMTKCKSPHCHCHLDDAQYCCTKCKKACDGNEKCQCGHAQCENTNNLGLKD